MKIAKAIPGTENVKPTHAHDCDCQFLGALEAGDGRSDLYACEGKEHGLAFVVRFGSDPSENGSFGDFTPPGSPYALAAALLERARFQGSAFRPRAWRVEGPAR